jgi:hypothetical protein
VRAVLGLQDLGRHGRPDTALEAEERFKTVVYGQLIADLELEGVTRGDFLEWRDRLLEGRQPRSVIVVSVQSLRC